jgi:hypothetical protein
MSYSLQNINIADSIRDKSLRSNNPSSFRNGAATAVDRKGSIDTAEMSPEELFAAANNRKKPGQLKDDLARQVTLTFIFL